ncbi:hypothetical protein VNI00_016013 [Paramarasmius palmivorus]|uniref:Uncharacterized protein n=1 Tax=Paramarasmius palmivorus TaxID=297713 RepID=A0AAW0BHV7_9AGAR
MKNINQKLQEWIGIETIQKISPFGNIYYVNNFSQLVAQEMANPRVRPFLYFFPEDAGKHVSEARHAYRWLEEVPDDYAPPMIRSQGQDYYTFEPTKIWNHSSGEEYCIPVRWFSRRQQLFARCRILRIADTNSGSGWVVLNDEIEGYNRYGVPDPRNILGIWDQEQQQLAPWDHPTSGNRWRAIANGKRVLSLPIWMYCDDTSGNLSKKWNKHNSFLFTLAGLSRKHAHKEYNVHFLSTSNVVTPMEMLDGIAEQLEQAQSNGIEAWDCVLNEDVLVVPWVLALLGDNPMGKFFCRICKVKGKDSKEEHGNNEDDTPPASRSSTPAPGDLNEPNALGDSETRGTKPTGRATFIESVSHVKRHITDFLKIDQLRTKQDTRIVLKKLFESVAHSQGTKAEFETMTTATGVKDPFLLHYVEKITGAAKKARGLLNKQAAVRSCIESLPGDVTSPVWHLKELDPHSDTPVEILHTVLLGFVKYMWRDVVQTQLNKKDAKKLVLEQRLSSFDTSGLGISPINGHTFVQYAGSLVGRDFRIVAQVAPFVLHDLVSKDLFETWCCLSKLIPMIWQPVIPDIDEYCDSLEREIKAFLLLTCRWTGRWFNKPKFHLLLHLPEHIRCFGPAILFATEAFESFNAVIRAKSVHSNRQAPSRDIARAFAQGNRIRHILSGGLFQEKDDDRNIIGERQKVGQGPLDLLCAPDSVLPEYLGLPPLIFDEKNQGMCHNTKEPKLLFSHTQTAVHHPQLASLSKTARREGYFQTAKSLILSNGDICSPGMTYFAVSMLHTIALPTIAKRLDPSLSDRNEKTLIKQRLGSNI